MKILIKNSLTALILIPLIVTPALAKSTNNMFGFWGSVTLKGDFKNFSEKLNNFHWQIMNQSRTREDSAKGSRLTENLLFGQIGYRLNPHASLWIGYVHDWIHPLNKPAFQENRIYEDFVWKQNIQDFKLLSRTRMDQRINQSNGKTAYRARQFLKIAHPLPLAKGLSAYVADEVLFYLDKNSFGKQGFSENRILAGLGYQLNRTVGIELGYLGQYVSTKNGSNLFTHNLQADINFKF